MTASSGGLNLSGTTLTYGSTPISGMGGAASIERVYSFTNRINFAGNIDVLYNDNELNGNTESQLQIAYQRQNNTWITSTTSSVNTTTNTVSDNFNNISFKALTLVSAGSVLPLLNNSFKAQLINNVVQLNWKVDQSIMYSYFEVQSSPDGSNWKKTGTVLPSASNHAEDYLLNDPDIHFTIRLYRLKLVMLSGRVYYSPVISLSQTVSVNANFISRKGGLKIWFTGWQPQLIQLYDAKGRLVRKQALRESVWETKGLTPGIYFLNASNNNQHSTHKIFVY